MRALVEALEKQVTSLSGQLSEVEQAKAKAQEELKKVTIQVKEELTVAAERVRAADSHKSPPLQMIRKAYFRPRYISARVGWIVMAHSGCRR